MNRRVLHLIRWSVRFHRRSLELIETLTEHLLLVAQTDQLSGAGWIYQSNTASRLLNDTVGEPSVIRHQEWLLLASLWIATIATTLASVDFHTLSIIITLSRIDVWQVREAALMIGWSCKAMVYPLTHHDCSRISYALQWLLVLAQDWSAIADLHLVWRSQIHSFLLEQWASQRVLLGLLGVILICEPHLGLLLAEKARYRALAIVERWLIQWGCDRDVVETVIDLLIPWHSSIECFLKLICYVAGRFTRIVLVDASYSFVDSHLGLRFATKVIARAACLR